ncbi:hypothetical protein EYZ11_007146 [Aspergillus tanneri]|uniref:FAD-binding domain-containing protein n=1 Tax=Aspergillus tanneri TaxID=1220188 RepID=A0A4S3JDR1_9EURO|nr:hypothetical protein EYZ11_007146 [Aspergillus tanneri]
MASGPFKVIIIGGSIAGLTLAHCLDKAGIDYVVLEKRKEVTPQEGASILILPHGGRILDQLGIAAGACRSVDKKVLALEHEQGSLVTVQVEDGAIYKGSLVVGADGVHSRVRSELWRLADKEKPGAIKDKEKSSMTVKYACVFGISNSVSNLVPGEQISTLNDGRSFLTFPGKSGRVFWFLMNKLERKYAYSEVPRLTSEDAKRMAEQYVDDHIWNGVHFKDIWDKREVFGATNLEENIFQTWHWGRVLCLGDSMHKMAPNTGQGANCAIEDAALLTNYLRQSINSTKESTKENRKLSDEKLSTVLEQFSQDRIERLQSIYRLARVVVRLHARQNLFLRLMGRYYLPHTGDLPADMASKSIAGGVYLDFLPLPGRSGPGWKHFASKTHSLPRSLTLFSALVLILGIAFWTGRGILLPSIQGLGLIETSIHS